MLAIVSPCDQPACAGHVHFELPDLDEWERRLLGRCDTSQVAYSIYGGERRLLGQPLARSDRELQAPHHTPLA